MTLQEARGIVCELFPNPSRRRTVCVQAQAWGSVYSDGTERLRTDFSISLQPGLDGNPCQIWESPTIGGALAKLRDELEPYPVTDEPIEATEES